MQYRVLTLTQPWATLIAIGSKRIETRSWRTDHRGPLLIHAAAGLGPVGGIHGLVDVCRQDYFFDALMSAGIVAVADTLPRGAIVAVCYLDKVLPIEVPVLGRSWTNLERCVNPVDLTDQERAFGDYSAGRYAWLLADIRALPEPIPAKGALGLWTWEGELPI